MRKNKSPAAKPGKDRAGKDRAGKDRAGKELAEAFLTLQNADEGHRFLCDICTPKEIADLADRWCVARLLDEGGRSY
ncbi:MAG: Trp family transcriptional regulator, partial [Pseudomonadota bacterium]|nr:Trp family transcriptional regulator [Pseudomonadota bacterium]